MSITNKLNQIKNAIYGKEVRGAIHDAIKQVYDDATVNHDNANMEVKMARGTHNTLNDRLDNVDEIQTQTNAQLSQSINYVTYEMFGAIGDGVADDSFAIKKAHEYANEHGLPIKANASNTYYVKENTNIPVKTNVDFNGATIIIDDKGGVDRLNGIFNIMSDHSWQTLSSPFGFTLTKTTHKIAQLAGHGNIIVKLENTDKKIFIRSGSNSNTGVGMKEYILVDNGGNILTPVTWDFSQHTNIEYRVLDNTFLTFSNGNFKTKHNDGEVVNNYYERGIVINRDRVVVENITHEIIADEKGAPYAGFIHPQECAHFIARDLVLNPHTTYYNASGTPLGTYELRLDGVMNPILERVNGDTTDTTKWGCMTSNYCKNMVVKDSRINRVDAHEGIHNLRIDNSLIGDKGIQVIGFGDLIVEHCDIVNCPSLLILRSDYGSHWDGRVIMKDIDFIPGPITYAPKIVNWVNTGTHDYGYECFFPKLYLEDIRIDDTAIDPTLLAYGFILLIDNESSRAGDNTSSNYLYPYYMPSVLSYKNMTTKSGKGFKFANNPRNLTSKNNFDYSVIEECATDSDGILKRIHMKSNMTVIMDNVQFGPITPTATSSHLFHKLDGVTATDDYYTNPKRGVVKFKIYNSTGIRAVVGATMCEIFINDTTISQLVGVGSGGSRMRGGATNCVISCNVPSVMNVVKVNYMDFPFTNCQFNKISVDGLPIEEMTKEELWGCYSFLYYFKNKQERFIHTRLRMSGCYLHPSINLKVIEPNLDDFDFQFSNHNFEFYPRKRGYASYRPVEGEGYSIPVGTTYYVTSSGKFNVWNGNEWTDL